MRKRIYEISVFLKYFLVRISIRSTVKNNKGQIIVSKVIILKHMYYNYKAINKKRIS